MSDADEELENLEIDLLLTGIVRRYGYDFRNYARASLRRRVIRAMEVEGVESISRLQEQVLRDPQSMARFVATLSVHVTAMFRDPRFYASIRTDVVPLLRTYPFVRIWHAGCSTGEEVYSLAILLHEEGIYERCRIYATDIADGLLETAAAGIFPLETMQANTRNYQAAGGDREFSSYYTAGAKRAIFRKFLRENMIFSNHNLVSDAVFNEFHLILCRNVMIYFDATLRERVHRLLYNSLSRFGVLGLGSKESLLGTPFAERYKDISAAHRIYRKER